MKRFVCVLLVAVMLAISSFPIFAANTDTEKVNISQNSSNFYCEFNSEKNIIEISGTISHDVLVKHGDYTICIYKIPFNTEYEDAIKNIDNRVVTHAPITIKFEYAVAVADIEDRFAKYALVLSSPQGDTYLASDMKIPAVYSEYADIDKSGFKGIETEDIARASNLMPGTAIVNVYLDSLYGNASNCYLYPMGDTFAYIDKSVISELDSQIMTLSQTGSRIYLRFLVLSQGSINAVSKNSDDIRAPYTVPDIYDASVLDFICAASSFIAERYNGSERGYINGVVLGTKVDDVVAVNYLDGLTFEKYVDKYVIYMLAVSNSVKSINSDIHMIVPISDANDYSSEYAAEARSADLIENILLELEAHVFDDPLFSVMLEIGEAPFGISNDTLGGIIDTSAQNTHKATVSVENIEVFAEYFGKLSGRFKNAPQNYGVLWHVPAELSGNALSCAYAYSYYKLFSFDNLSEFVVSFDESSVQRFDELSNIFGQIDTENTFNATQNILKYFGVSSWSNILRVKKASAYAMNTYYEMSLLEDIPSEVKGKFTYFDFSSTTGTNHWKNGINTKSTKTEYSEAGVRALHISSRKIERGDSFEVYYLYESPENLIYTPYLVFDLNIDALDTNSVFEVSVMLGNDNTMAYASRALSSGDSGRIIVDIDEFADQNKAQYLKISVRALTDSAESVSVWLNNIEGYSDEYDNETLARMIELERLRVQDEYEEANESNLGVTVTTVIIITIVALAVAVGLFGLFKKEGGS